MFERVNSSSSSIEFSRWQGRYEGGRAYLRISQRTADVVIRHRSILRLENTLSTVLKDEFLHVLLALHLARILVILQVLGFVSVNASLLKVVRTGKDAKGETLENSGFLDNIAGISERKAPSDALIRLPEAILHALIPVSLLKFALRQESRFASVADPLHPFHVLSLHVQLLHFV